MYHSYKLDPNVWHAKPIEFEWDAAAGALRGKDAAQLVEMIDQALAAGEIVGHPYPTSFKIEDPYHRSAEMAVILGQYWKLPADLAAAYPKAEDDDDLIYEVGTDGVERVSEFQPLE